ncbi:MAG: lysophospholipid acyltransferase family protein [Candidatus Lokiarchaeia archaeon]
MKEKKSLLLILKILFFPIVRFVWVGRLSGLGNIPSKGSGIIASNHESYFDFFCFLAVSKRWVYYLTKKEHFEDITWGPFMKYTGQIEVDRESSDKTAVYEQALEVLREGKLLGIFPEGTRSPNGKLQKAHTGVAKIALLAKAPVIPVGMMGTFKILSKFQYLPRFRKCQIRIGKPISLEKYYGQEITDSLLRELTDNIMKTIGELTKEKYPC